MYSTIVVGVDGSEHGLAATRFAAALARRFAARLIVAGVHARAPHVRTDGGAAEELARAEAEEFVERGLAAAGDVADARKLIASAGSAAAGLHEIARAEGADLLVVGTSERRKLAGTQPGSVTEHVLHHSPCPVAVVPPMDGEPTLRRIGVAMDEREPAQAALAAALALADRAGGDVEEIVLLHAEMPEPMFLRPGMQLPAATKVETPDWLRTLVEGLEAPVPVRIDTEVGGASATVAGGAENLDLLLMGSRDRGPVRRLLMGSVSTYVVRHAACPVIIVFGREESDRDAASAQVQATK